MKKYWIAISVAVIAIVVGVIFIKRGSNNRKPPEISIQTVQVKKSDPLSFNGIAKSKNTQSITLNQALGENIHLEKQSGEAVTQGDLVATYYSLKDYNTLLNKQRQVRQKNDEIDQLKKDVQNNSAKITTLTNDVNQLNKELNKMRDDAPNKIYAQFDGVVTVPTSSSDGMKPVAEISSNDASVVISVSEYDLSHLFWDQEVKLAPVDSGTKIKGKITNIADRPDNTTSKISTYTAQIKPDEELKNGSHVQVTIPLKEIKIPKSAVKEEDKKFFVYKANGSKYTKKEIQGTKKDNYFVVTSGLKSNESIVKNYKEAD
ncbi:efflux RND transporter periplasmic adaptor subunit [Xylocopilactobacillus apicola]|uniref:RND transporter MFP subunit n=1 Tax=Xylocopilactobacillus apicola TaxID=2932184 RepID=A0AAU9D652_9LACO|nr:HlyD family efflux transporter periplasmic adaptor subunit [Xylocopilactobacillus apicola]BDR57866.1 RND transporter MFP subunit [Xylocopilactobacillus apicola]